MFKLFRKSAPIPDKPDAGRATEESDGHKARGNAFFAQGRWDEAAESFRAAIASHPGNAAAHFNLGLVLRERGRLDDAVQSFARAFEADPAMADAPHLTGAIRHQQGDLVGAVAFYRQAVAAEPGLEAAHTDLALALGMLGRHEEALKACDSSLALNPDNPAVHNNRGYALTTLRRLDEALQAYGEALRLAPGSADIHNSRGLVFNAQGRHAQGLECFEHALQHQPGHADALSNRATALGRLGRREESMAAFEALVKTAPDHEYAIGFLLDAKTRACDWADRERLVAMAEGAIRAGKRTIAPFPWLAVSDSPELQLRCSRTCQQDRFPAAAQPMWRGERYRHGKIRIAYVSADFHNHATAYLMAQLFELHDPERFETTALSYGAERGGDMRRRLERAFTRFVDVQGQSDREIARLMLELEIDIAVDLKGYTQDARIGIFAHRAAPVQVSYIGYPGTTAAPYMDYVIADAQVQQPQGERWYTEKVVYMPDSYQVNDTRRRIAPQTPTRAQQALPAEGFVFCCFNNNYKITPPVFDAWMRLLGQVPGSVLWLLEDSAQAAGNLRKEAAARGVAPERLVFAARAPLDEHLARHRLADLFLDTQPYNAHTTASDALWAGLPVVTCKGATFPARVAASLLHAAGMPELVTHKLADYEALALALATTPARLAAIREKLASRREACALFDTDRFRRHLESAYLTMWQRAQRGEAPQSFAVEPLPP